MSEVQIEPVNSLSSFFWAENQTKTQAENKDNKFDFDVKTFALYSLEKFHTFRPYRIPYSFGRRRVHISFNPRVLIAPSQVSQAK